MDCHSGDIVASNSGVIDLAHDLGGGSPAIGLKIVKQHVLSLLRSSQRGKVNLQQGLILGIGGITRVCESRIVHIANSSEVACGLVIQNNEPEEEAAQLPPAGALGQAALQARWRVLSSNPPSCT